MVSSRTATATSSLTSSTKWPLRSMARTSTPERPRMRASVSPKRPRPMTATFCMGSSGWVRSRFEEGERLEELGRKRRTCGEAIGLAPLIALRAHSSLEVVSNPSAGRIRMDPCQGSPASNRVLKRLLRVNWLVSGRVQRMRSMILAARRSARFQGTRFPRFFRSMERTATLVELLARGGSGSAED